MELLVTKNTNKGANIFKRVLDLIDEKELVRITRELVQIPSVNPPGEEKEAAEYVANEMRRIGLDVKIYEAETDRPNVIGVLKGNGNGLKLILNGHTDVVPVGEGWSVDPFGAEVKNGRIYGRGSADMKSGLAAMLVAANALKESKVDLKGDLILTVVVDEETGGNKGTGYLVDRGLIDGDMAIVCEPSDLKLVNAEDGFLCLEVTTSGKTAHPCIGYGMDAVYEMATLIVKLRERLDQEFKNIRHETVGTPAITFSIIQGGTHIATVPSSCRAGLYLKLVPGDPSQQPDEAYKLVKRAIDKLMELDENLKANIRPWPELIFAAPPFEVPKDAEIIRLVKEAAFNVLGKYPDFWAPDHFGRNNFDFAALRAKPYSDMFHLFVKGGIPSVYFGPGKIELSHVIDEYVEINQILDACKIYATVAVEVLS